MYDNIPLDNRLLKQWLKSGFIKDDTLFPTDAGTPQGGIISPILANMVLDGIEDIVKNHKARFQKMVNGVIIYRHTNRLNFIRYADDFVITGRTPEDLRLVQKDIEKFLNIRGLELSKEKTHITNIRDGFDFLGFNFRKYPNDKVIVTPTKDGIKSFKSKIKEIFKKYNSSSLTMLITKLNPLLRGWANYYRFVNSKVIFSKLDSYIWRKSLNWMKRIHQRRETKKYYKQYFKPFPNYKSDVLSDGRQFVYRLSTLPLKEFIKIKSEANPYDTSFDDYFIKRYFTLKNLTKKI